MKLEDHVGVAIRRAVAIEVDSEKHTITLRYKCAGWLTVIQAARSLLWLFIGEYEEDGNDDE